MATPAQTIPPAPSVAPAAPTFVSAGKDTSAEAIKEPIKTEAPPVTAPAAATPTALPAKTEEKLLAGKYKTAEELEKGYLESQKGFQARVEAEVTKRMAEAQRPGAENKTATQMTQEKIAETAKSMTPDEAFSMITERPQEFVQKVTESVRNDVLTALRVERTLEQWRKDNADILPHERYINAEVLSLAQERPELIADHAALLTEATGRFRNMLAEVRNQGKTEALTVKETTSALNVGTPSGASQEPAPTQQTPRDPLTEEQARHEQFQESRRNPRAYGGARS